jgi:hypothetical protein
MEKEGDKETQKEKTERKERSNDTAVITIAAPPSLSSLYTDHK